MTHFAHLIKARVYAGKSLKPAALAKASLSPQVTVQARGRGNPSINLSDGRDLITSYSGPSHLTRAWNFVRDEGLIN